jgi:crotonobetainyl-CoA:carnitine CoA-transferase CaiB-like acyl-CoA transferase
MLSSQIIKASPVLPPVPIADLSSAMFATVGILAALYNREKTGKGQYIDVSMTEGLVSWMSIGLLPRLQRVEGGPEYREQADPSYGIYGTKDKKYITLSIAFEDHFWRNLCGAIGKEEFAGLPLLERMQRQGELVDMLKEAFLTKTRDEWVDLLSRADVPCGPAYTLSEVIDDPHLREHGMFVEIDDPKKGKIKQVAPSLRFSETPAEVRMPPPEVGEHTEEILLDLGYSKGEIDEMRKEGII